MAPSFTPDGVPFERTVPFSIDISNQASGVALLIEYIPLVVTIGVTPSGDTPTGPVKPDAVGHPAIYWPRGWSSYHSFTPGAGPVLPDLASR
jgi:hypothetical protein